MDVDIGKVIAGKFELVRLIGKGAMGEVWLAKHNTLGGEFAIKLVEPADDVEAETAAGRFQLEAQIAAKLSRKTRHIVSVSDHGEEEGLAYLVMELLEGESLESKLQRVGRLDLPEVAAIVSQVARALGLAHEEGVFHRDLKPANVWLGKDEDGRLLVKLLDFGIARAQKSFRTRSPFVTSKDMVLGTPSYMSPEQARGLDSLDHRCDLWALSVVAYEALATKIPFAGETVEDIFLSICTFRVIPIAERRGDLGPAVEAFFQRAFAAKIEDRFATADDLSAVFEQLVTPEELENALGIPFTPSSARRLEAARRSPPDAAEFARPPTPPSQPNLPVAMAPGALETRQRSSPDIDPVSLGDAVVPRRGASMWIVAVAAALAAVVVGVLLFVTFRGPAVPAASHVEGAPPSIVAPAPASASVAPPTTALRPTTALAPSAEPAPPTRPVSVPSVVTSKPERGKPANVGAGNGNGKPKPAGDPPAPAAAAASRTPAPARSVNRGEVF